MKIVIAPDSYKGCMSAVRVAAFMEEGILKALSNPEIVKIPVADGGEGTLAALGGANRTSVVSNPLGDPVEARWRLAADQRPRTFDSG